MNSPNGLVIFVYLCFIYTTSPVISLRLDDIVVVVLSQGDQYHANKAEQLRQNIIEQAASINQKPPSVRIVHKEFPHVGAWTVVPLFPWLNKLHSGNSSWFFFAEEKTQINLTELVTLVEGYDEKEAIWMGHGLTDEEATIIHHFAFADNPSKFKYPLFSAGFVMSTALIVEMSKKYKEMAVRNSDFSIDASHELALYVDIPLIDLPRQFCIENGVGCLSYPKHDINCGEPVPKESIFFAVKTCAKYHKDRVPVVKSTWAQQTAFIEFFSHEQDEEIPTTVVGVENTERGHCKKSFAIVRLVNQRIKKEIPSIKWIVLADDDTLISVPRLQTLLSCWSDSGEIAVGERYGYNVRGSKVGGFNYLTGGGGIIISASTIPHILKNCACQGDDSPDDMFLGLCMAKLNIPLVHSPSFHQARPNDYAMNYLAIQSPVSFHKHWMIDPLAVYDEWLSSSDNHVHKHTEL
ncbi:hypothetical protein LSTR_LSTR007166 [Laodelphax striatellus]|uniref:Fringe-like glycosyltransferase domain-containing protein n=1 Tax=Laodelphax striatellus TaxID=195883 RepID=A0A482WW89_LAOST|nr:hypothetical protein LSTR_LSTR007166 [Laodelphax striatellus]